ncbi:putative transglutaminase [Bifidobacterium pullorum subsp. saeculare DSM 6531 = LMG 14934]|uniref:Putative transglutaminase n=1 Tax=Bifidobacterium pullorum subsp. saeculare DSM 6531 = LMG 14934 TaxID=1437611 RepID=A0A087CZS3_9BIFI|nr:transglutaminaseTgpA domain-containing protein [Bifidobacterium pullorum]KFI88773.1 putative transglutaminase [Bifidobacterium pullorum subsp. saeculare DSM 6531 = LMG 14934]
MMGIRRGKAGRIRPRRAHWCRFALIRPSVGGWAMIPVAVAVWYMALLLDERTLVAAALTLTAAWGLDLVMTVVQGVLIATSSLPPTHPTTTVQIERLDADGHRLERYVGLPQDTRGWYRRVAQVIRWRSPMRLFAGRVPVRDGGEFVILPDAAAPSGSQHATDARLQGQDRTESTGTIRAYTPGDSPNLISWRHSAHRGTLMTRESGRDTRATLIIVLDAAVDQGDGDRGLEGHVIRAQQLLPATSSTDRFVVTDGIHMADDRASALRLLAAVTPAAQPRLQPDADRTPSAVNRTPSDPADAADAADPATPQRAAAIIAAAAAVPGHGPVTIAVITSQPQGPLVQAIRTAIAGARTLPVQPWHEAAERMIATSLPERRSSVPAGHRRDRSPVIDARDRTRGSRAQGNPPSPTMAMRLIRVGVLAVYAALTIMGAAGLADAGGWWPWTAGLMLAAVIVESSVLSRTPLRGALRVVGMAVLLAVAGLTAAGVRIDVGSMLDTAGTASEASAGGGTPGMWDVIRLVPDMAAATVQGAATVGFESLRRQLPPLTVNPAGDACLIIICAMVAIAIRCLLYWRVGVPLLALLPLAALAADYSLVGHAAAWRQVLLLVVAFVLSLLTVRGTIGVSPPTCAAALAAVTALAMALTPATLSLAYNVPLSIGESTGLFTSNTVNPMVDLRRTLQSRSRAVVLTYESGTPLTLRMATLGDFDGDTWSYEEQFAKDGSLYGSGIQLGRDSSNTLSDEERTAGMMTPLPLYLIVSYLTRGGETHGLLGDGTPYSEFAFSPQHFVNYATITIDRLNSRFLPMPGIINPNSLQFGSSTHTGWLCYSDGTVYNRTTIAAQGTRYYAEGLYLDPIGADDGFAQIDSLDDWREQLLDMEQSPDWPTRTAARLRYIAAGNARQVNGWMLIPLTGDFDNPQSVLIWRDAAGNEVSRDNEEFTDAVQLSGNESLIVFQGSGNTATAALPLYDPSEYYGDGAASEDGAVDGDGVVSSDPVLDELLGMTGRFNAEGDERQRAEEAAFADLQDISQREGLSDSGVMIYDGLAPVASPADSPWLRQALAEVEHNQERVHDQYTALPDDLPQSVRAVVDQAQSDGVTVPAADHDEQIAAMRWLVDYFTDPDNGFVYTLDAPDGDGRNNLEVVGDFLERRSGYCSHYASALAVLGRALGVPTRMVLGYSASGVQAEADFTYEVTADQLHAWVEAYIDDVGWVPFDVTPASTDDADADDTADTPAAQSGDDTDAPVPEDDADAADGDGTTTDDDTTDSDGNTGEDGEATSEQQALGTSDTSPATLLAWAVGGIGVVLAVTALCCLPMLVRRRRRRRRLRIASGTGADGERWIAAWQEIVDSAWDNGVRWGKAETDRDIVRRITDRLESGSSAGTETIEQVGRIAVQATAAAFGGTSEHAGDLAPIVESAVEAMRAANAAPRHRRILGVLCPASLFRARR